MSRRDFLLGYAHAMRKVAGDVSDELDRLIEGSERDIEKHKAMREVERKEYEAHMKNFGDRVRRALSGENMLEDENTAIRRAKESIKMDQEAMAGFHRKTNLAKPVLQDLGHGGLGALAIGGAIGIPLATGAGMYYLYKSRKE